MTKHLEAKFAGKVEVTSGAGRGSSFEVTVNGVLIHSKLESSMWADTDAVTATVAKVVAGESVPAVDGPAPTADGEAKAST